MLYSNIRYQETLDMLGCLGQDALHMFADELPAGHAAQVVEGAALDEDENIEAVRPELPGAPLQTHVLQHRAFPDASRSLQQFW